MRARSQTQSQARTQAQSQARTQALRQALSALLSVQGWRVLGHLLRAKRDLRGDFARAIAPTPLGSAQRRRIAEPEQLARLVFGIGRRVPGSRCLDQALALTRMLRAEGHAAELAIGARREGGFAAHAWVECAGHVYDPEPQHVPGFSRLL